MSEVTPRFKEPKKAPRPRAWNSTLPRASRVSKRSAELKSGARNFSSGVTGEMRSEVFRRAGGRCQADGLHHRDCPGVLKPGWVWNAHHVLPRSKGGADELENLIAVWTGAPGVGGCHSKIHSNPTLAKSLGLLAGRAA